MLGSSFMQQDSDISLCSVCKTFGKMFVDALVQRLNKVSLSVILYMCSIGLTMCCHLQDSSVRNQLNKLCQKAHSFLRKPVSCACALVHSL